MADTDRIAQFRKMANDDPNNELAHFSLGRALADANQHDEAVESFKKAIDLNPNISKVYHLLAASLLKLNERQAAITALIAGVKVADARGDHLPRREMAALLGELGAPVPEAPQQQQVAVSEGQVRCKRCGQLGPKLAKPPFRNEFGQAIYENICTACWREAIGMGTKVINELRLPMSDPQAQKIWDQHIREFLNL